MKIEIKLMADIEHSIIGIQTKYSDKTRPDQTRPDFFSARIRVVGLGL